MAESAAAYRMAIAMGDLMDADREGAEAFRRATVNVHHFKLQLEKLPVLDEEDPAERTSDD